MKRKSRSGCESPVRPVFGIGLSVARIRWIVGLLIALLPTIFAEQAAAEDKAVGDSLRAALLSTEMATESRLKELRSAGYKAIVRMLQKTDSSTAAADRMAVERIGKAGLQLHYWIEIGRCPELADEHPRWMASLQGHPEWRRFHKDVPQPGADEIIKVYPWTPVSYREAFAAHLSRVQKLLADRPPAEHVFLNDLQAAPSACGCGNPVCRWTADYGPVVTATPRGDQAATRFVAAVKQLLPEGARAIPVWTTECEAHDKANEALCAGVDCYQGICWKAYSRQLKPLAAESELIGALLLYKEFGQDGPHNQQPAGWVGHALKHGFAEQPAKHGGTQLAPSRLIAVLQGWDVSDAEIQAQIDQSQIAGAAGFVVAFAEIDQSWQPQLLKWK